MPNPYASALKVDPNREREELVKLKQNPQKLAELGLRPDEDFSALKNDPNKYNKVLSYVKSQAYASPAYSALESGQGRADFTTGQLGPYSQTTAEFTAQKAPELRQQFGVDQAERSFNELNAGAASAPVRLREQVKTQGGYDIDKLKAENDRAVQTYLDTREKFFRGEVPREVYMSALSQLSTNARSLDLGQEGLTRETDRAVGAYGSALNSAKSTYDSASKRYTDALTREEQGYGDARTEKIRAAQEMYDSAKSLLDDSMKQQQGELREIGGSLYQVSYDPATGGYKTVLVKGKPADGSGSPATNKLFTEADGVRKELAEGKIDWGQGFNRMKAQFPGVPDSQIDAALGGSGGYDPATGSFDQSKATGFAKEGNRSGKVDYTDQEYKKLREANIDPNNIAAADSYLYGKDEGAPGITEDWLRSAGIKEKKIAETMAAIKLYKDAGYTDKQILDLMGKK